MQPDGTPVFGFDTTNTYDITDAFWDAPLPRKGERERVRMDSGVLDIGIERTNITSSFAWQD